MYFFQVFLNKLFYILMLIHSSGLKYISKNIYLIYKLLLYYILILLLSSIILLEAVVTTKMGSTCNQKGK